MIPQLVSIIMPVYNAEKYVESAIMSVINQTFTNWELIIVDDGSTDSSGDIIREFADGDPRVIYLYQKNRKQAAARNNGIRHAKGDLIAFLDADDLWVEEKLKIQVESLRSVNADLCYSGGVIIDGDGKFQCVYPTIFGKFSGADMYKRMYEYNPIPVMSVLVKKSTIAKVGFQDEAAQIVGCEDFDYWLRIANVGAIFLGIEENLFSYRINPTGTSRGVLQMKIAECYALYKNLNADIFKDDDKEKMHLRFLDLVRYIVPQLFALKRYKQIPYYFKILSDTTGLFKYRFAELLFRFSQLRSEKILNYLLHANI